MLAREIMSTPVITVTEQTPLTDVATLMKRHDIGCVPVVDDSGKLVGIITESDFTGIRHTIPFSLNLAPVIYGSRPPSEPEFAKMIEHARAMKAREIMTSERLESVPEDMPVGEVVHTMLKRQLKHLPVVKDGRPIGIIARHDLLGLFAQG